jgi:hypothetical protein
LSKVNYAEKKLSLKIHRNEDKQQKVPLCTFGTFEVFNKLCPFLLITLEGVFLLDFIKLT